MSNTGRRVKVRRSGLNAINELFETEKNVLVIHYSCESFYDRPEGTTPRITSIAIRYLESAQTKSFSIHKYAELAGYSLNQLETKYGELEKRMLNEFYDFVRAHLQHSWVHWNMRDANYGFEALKLRAQIHGVSTADIPDTQKFDLARLLIDIYGKGYTGHPRLPTLIAKNNISSKNYLDGQQEADAFNDKEYVKLHQSTLAKVDVLNKIFFQLIYGKLKKNYRWTDVYGKTPEGLIELAKDHWLASIVLAIILGVAIKLIVNLITHLLG